MNEKVKKWIWLSFPLAVLVGIASSFGAFNEKAYELDAPAYAIQGVGQDFATLFIAVPALVITAIFALRNSLPALLINLGVQVYLLYTYSMYAITIVFDDYFLIYCGAMGLAFYGIIGIVSKLDLGNIKEKFLQYPKEKSVRISIVVLMFISAALFYYLWLSDIIPNLLAGTIPDSLKEINLPSNIVHVYDLAILLPALVMGGIWLLNKKTYGFLIAPVLMFFSVFMTTALVAMVIFMANNGWTSDFSPAIIFSVFTIFDTWFGLRFIKAVARK